MLNQEQIAAQLSLVFKRV